MINLKSLIVSVSVVSAFSVAGQTQSFVSTGTNSFVVPPSVVSLKAECVGGGGAGGRVTPSNILDNDANTGAIIVHTQNGSASTISPLTVINNTVSVSITGLNESSAIYSGGNSATYQWLDCANSNAPISNFTNESEVFNQVGIYSVVVTENGCTLTSDCFIFNSLEVNEQNKNDFVVYPNPVENTFKIESNETIDRAEVVDLNGKVVAIVSQSNIIDMTAFENGVYIVKIYSGLESWTGKIVKK